MIQDLRYAFRGLARRPGFTAIAVVTLSLGIGATTAIFSVVQAVLLRPLEFDRADRLVKVVGFDKADGIAGNLSPADFADFERDNTTMTSMGANGFVGLATISDGRGEAERAGSVQVTSGFFSTLHVQPALGRLISADDDRPGAARVVVLSHGFWQRRFGGDPSMVGRSISLNAAPATVIGILPENFRHLEINPERPADLFSPFRFDPAQPNRGAHFIRAVGRLKDGVTVDQARAEIETIAARLEQQYPNENTDQGVRLNPLLDSMVSESQARAAAAERRRRSSCCWWPARTSRTCCSRAVPAGFVNSRCAPRSARIGGRLVRQMLTESAALSMLGAAGGLLLAYWATRALTGLAATGIPRADQIGLNVTVLGFAVAAAMLTSVVFGLLPALHLSKHDFNDALKEGGRSQSAALGRGARELLIVAEVAMSIVLLIGAGLLIRSLWQLQQVDPGFSADKVLAMEVSLPTARYEEGEQMPFYQRLEERIAAKPGVAAVGAVNILPLSSNYDSRGVQVEDHPRPEGQGYAPQARSATPGYFAAMGIPLLAGRHFDAHDVESGQLAVIVSETMARKYWPGETSVIGKRITFNSGIPREKQQVVGGAGSRVVVGVVGNVKHLGLDEDEVPMFYTPHTQQPSYHTMRMVVRADAEPAALTRMVREELVTARSRSAAVAGDDAVAGARRDGGRATDAREPARIVCGPRHGAGGNRRLRRGGVHGRPAHAGDRRTPRPRRKGRRCVGDAVA